MIENPIASDFESVSMRAEVDLIISWPEAKPLLTVVKIPRVDQFEISTNFTIVAIWLTPQHQRSFRVKLCLCVYIPEITHRPLLAKHSAVSGEIKKRKEIRVLYMFTITSLFDQTYNFNRAVISTVWATLSVRFSTNQSGNQLFSFKNLTLLDAQAVERTKVWESRTPILTSCLIQKKIIPLEHLILELFASSDRFSVTLKNLYYTGTTNSGLTTAQNPLSHTPLFDVSVSRFV